MVSTEAWLKRQPTTGSVDFLYELLLSRYLLSVFSSEEKISEALRKNRQRPVPGDPAGLNAVEIRLCESMHYYVDHIENQDKWKVHLKMLWRMSEDRSKPLQEVLPRIHSQLVVAWFTMIFRGLCWYQLHCMVPGPLVGSKYWNSQQSVYIT